MRDLTFEELYKLYEMIEKAVEEDAPVRFPVGVHPVLQVGNAPTGPTFTIPGLFWMDEKRNIYQAWMQMETRRKDHYLPGLYVRGTNCPDGKSSGDLRMIKPENRYKTII